jgi:hypothetical protein
MIELILLHGNKGYVILMDDFQTLICFNSWSSVSVRHYVLTSLAHVNACITLIVRIQAGEYAIIAAVERQPRRSSRESHENWDYPNRGSSK